jgi:hypothetical protein
VSGRHFSLVLISFSFCGVTESGGRGLEIAPSAFVVVPMNVSTPPVLLAACSTTLAISPSTVVLLALVLPSSKWRDIDTPQRPRAVAVTVRIVWPRYHIRC